MSTGLAAICIASPALATGMGATDEPIRLAVNEWTGQHVTTHVAGGMLEAAGYDVEYVTAGVMNQFQALADGDIHATLEIWSSNVSDEYARQLEAGNLDEIGDLGLEAKEGTAYPAHVAEICPSLPEWQALKDCAMKFATADTVPQGRLVDYPAEWGTPGADRMAGLDLPFRAVPAGSSAASTPPTLPPRCRPKRHDRPRKKRRHEHRRHAVEPGRAGGNGRTVGRCRLPAAGAGAAVAGEMARRVGRACD